MLGRRIRVVCRLRQPTIPGEACSVDITDNRVIHAGKHSFEFDTVYSAKCRQAELFEYEVQVYIAELLRGRNSMVLLFGTTHSGKSHTLRGGKGKERGVILRAVESVLGLTGADTEYQVQVSVFHVYMEQINDLLTPENVNLALLENQNHEIEGLTAIPVANMNELHTVLHQGLQNRKNETAIRSDPGLKQKTHFVVRVSVMKHETRVGFQALSHIDFVELAGSENASNDAEVWRSNGINDLERKFVARSFNAIFELVTEGYASKESALALCLKNSVSNVLLVNTINPIFPVIKHTIAALKFSNRIKQETNLENLIVGELEGLKAEILDAKPVLGLDWLEQKDQLLQRLRQHLLSIRSEGLGFAKTLLIECDILDKQLSLLRERWRGYSTGDSTQPQTQSYITPRFETEQRLRLSVSGAGGSGSYDSLAAPAAAVSPPREFATTRDHSSPLTTSAGHIYRAEKTDRGPPQRASRSPPKRSARSSTPQPAHSTWSAQSSQRGSGYANEISQLKQELSHQKHLLESQQETRRKATEDELSSRRRRESELEKQVFELERSLANERETFAKQLTTLRATVDTSKSEIIEIKDKSTEKIQTSERELAQLQAQVAEKSRELERVLSSQTTAQEHTESLNHTISTLRAKLVGLESENETLRDKTDKLSRTQLNTESKVTILEGNLANEKEINAANLKELEKTTNDLREMTDANGALNEIVTRMKGEEARLRNENNELQTRLAYVQDQYAETSEKLQAQTEGNEVLSAELRDIQVTVAEMKDLQVRLEQDLDLATNVKDNLASDLNSKEAQLRDTQLQLDAALNEAKRTADALEETLNKARSLETERDELRDQMESWKEQQGVELTMVEDQIEHLESELGRLQDQNAVLKARERELVAELRAVERSRDSFKEELMDARQGQRELETQLQSTEQQVHELILDQRQEMRDIREFESKKNLGSRLKVLESIHDLIRSHRP